MDNDNLINQARRLYAALQVEQYMRSLKNTARFDRLDGLVKAAYCRYQRRLNHCVLCYRQRLSDCDREHLKRCNQELWKKLR
jgi:hypothetical protein